MEQFSVTRHQSGSFAFVGSHCLQYTPDPATCILPFFVFLSETATSAGPVPLILYFTDQVWAEALLGCFRTFVWLAHLASTIINSHKYACVHECVPVHADLCVRV